MGQIIEVTGREFRAHQKTYFDYASQGKQVIIRRKEDSYLLAPLEKDDLQLSPAMIERIERGLKDMREGKGVVYNREDFKRRFGL